MADHSFGFIDKEKGNAETLRGRTSKNNFVDVWMNKNDFLCDILNEKWIIELNETTNINENLMLKLAHLLDILP